MRICQKCGSPDNGTGVCSNCGSTVFREITPSNNNRQNNYGNVQHQVSNGYQNNYGRYSAQQTPNYVAQQPYGYGVHPSGFFNGGAGAGAAVAGGVVKTASKAGSAKIIISLLIVLVVLVSGISATVVAVKNEHTPEKTLAKFEEAYNNQDINGLMECFDSKIRKAYDAGDSLLGGVLGFSYKDAADLLPFLSDALGEGDAPQIHLEVISVEDTGDNTCTVHVKTTMSYGSDDEDDEDLYDDEEEDEEYDEDSINMVKEDGKWYISDEELLDAF